MVLPAIFEMEDAASPSVYSGACALCGWEGPPQVEGELADRESCRTAAMKDADDHLRISHPRKRR